MFYREAGQFKASYQADAAIFPIRQDRIAIAVILLVAFIVVPFTATPYLFTGILIPFLILSLAALGPQHPDRLRGPALARQRGVHGGGRVRLVQLHAARPGDADPGRLRRRRRRRGAGRHPVRPAEPAHPRLLPRGRHARRAILHPVVPDEGGMGDATTARRASSRHRRSSSWAMRSRRRRPNTSSCCRSSP